MQHFIQSTQAVYRAGRLVLGVAGLVLVSLVSNGQDGAEYVTVVAAKAPPKLSAQISGVITDAATKKPLTGARVFYKNLTTSITGDDGRFTLAVPSANVSVGVEIAGYQSREVAIDGRKTLNVALNEGDRPSLFNPLVLANHVVPANRLTNAAATADMSDIWTRYNETPDSYLQGKIAGLNSIRGSGMGNARANLLLRGYTSLSATNQPLIIVDNMVYDNGTYGSSLTNNYAENPLANIDIRDISNITVLKDAAVTAQYGTKAANGVIVITTSRARDLGTRIDLAMNGGMNLAPTSLPLLNASDYRTYLGNVLSSGGVSTEALQALPYFNDAINSGTYYQYHNTTDWQKKLFTNSLSNNMYLKVTGGDNIAKYALSMNYLTNNTALAQSNVSKYSTRFNADLNLSNRLKGVANMSFSYNEANVKDMGFAPKTNPVFLSLVKAPFLSDYEISPTGIASPDYADEDIFKVGNPTVVSQLMQASNRAYRFVGGLGLQYNVAPGLELGANVSVIFDKIKENRFVPRRGILSDTLSNAIAQNQLGSQTKRLFNFNTEAYASYAKTINYRHEFSTRVGVRFLNSKVEQDRILGYNSATDELISAGNGVSLLNNLGGGLGEYNWLNTYLTMNYAFADKYFLTLSAALDGSSRFGKQVATESIKIGGMPFALMPAVSAAWQISSERFMANSPFDLLKLRASYGRVGNDDIGNYGSRQYYVGQNLLGIQGLIRSNIANPALKWETVTKANLGLDMALLNDRVSLSLDVFRNKTTDMLILETTPTVAGISTMLRNGGGMTTSGVEATLNVKLLNRPNLKWDLGMNIGRAVSVIDQLPDGNLINTFGPATYLTSTGQAPNAFYGYVAQGVFATDAQATAAGLQTRLKDGSLRPFRGGDVQFVDLDNNKIIDEKDRQIIGKPTPDFFGGINNHIGFGNLSVEALVTFVSGNSLYNYTRNVLESVSGTNNQSQATLNRWRGDGQVTDVPRATLGDPLGNARFSNRWIEDGSYIRLRSVSVAYNFPINRTLLKYLTLYASASNLLTFTKYLGYDPEFNATNSLFGQGVDNTLEPIQKSVQIGVKFGL
ncbi:SusC/RagA family TonB-linked outer membrane protein [Fibrivirga algicola]|uniref:SusC/RagA family TonB-linked outer membrane protein n=1 Tax=Fibrivirga algicola TaxID=2950420 RepID=A0ABX0QCG6_9BACT|nr:SusC/RagA family TonB-linked outer membrane protein [Fibrivirga algicola]NID10045.1 SusC/RagA family TonB-linked outer membrane protein [Fibrivirga algicola]